MERQLIIEREKTPQKLGEMNDQGRFRIAVITPGMGSSGHYSAEVLKQAVEDGIFAVNTHCYIDHPSLDEQWTRPERSIRDLAGVLETAGVWEEDGPEGPGVYADFLVFSNYKPMLQEMAPHIGMSIRAWCESEWVENEGGSYYEITRFDLLESVDAVTHAGRGGAFVKMLESARQKPITPSERKKVGGDLPSTRDSVSSGTADHTEGNTKMDADIQKAFEDLGKKFDDLPASIGAAVAEAVKPKQEEADPVDVAQGIALTLAESGIPATAHAKFYELVKTGMSAESAVTFLSDLVGKTAPVQAQEAGPAQLGKVFGRGDTASTGQKSVGTISSLEALANRTRAGLGIAAKGA